MAMDVFIWTVAISRILTQAAEESLCKLGRSEGRSQSEMDGPEIRFAMWPKMCNHPQACCYIAARTPNRRLELGGSEHHALVCPLEETFDDDFLWSFGGRKHAGTGRARIESDALASECAAGKRGAKN